MSKLVDMAVKMYEGLTPKEKEVLAERFRGVLEKSAAHPSRLVALDALRQGVEQRDLQLRGVIGPSSGVPSGIAAPSSAQWNELVQLAIAARPS